jgi:hypothetical protein
VAIKNEQSRDTGNIENRRSKTKNKTKSQLVNLKSMNNTDLKPVSLDCSFLIATLVFYSVYITVYPVSLFSHLTLYHDNQYSTSLNRSLTSLLKIYTVLLTPLCTLIRLISCCLTSHEHFQVYLNLSKPTFIGTNVCVRNRHVGAWFMHVKLTDVPYEDNV